MAEEKASVYLLHGDDAHGIQAAMLKMLARVDPSLAELNVTRLSGKTASMDSLHQAVQSLPFLSERRLVILSEPLDLARGPTGAQRMQTLLSQVPPTSALVLLLVDEQERGDWKKVPKKKPFWLRKWAEQAGDRAYWKEFLLPAPGAMAGWITGAVKLAGGQFTREAASQLADAVGSDTALATLEIDKLLNYVDFARPVERDDVIALTVAGHQASVFDFVDCLAGGDRSRAVGLLRRLLFDQEAIVLFGMVVRQFRLLIQARDTLDAGLGADELIRLGMNRGLAGRMLGQAQRFQMAQLREIYRRLLEMDAQFKTGQITYELALEMFAAGE